MTELDPHNVNGRTYMQLVRLLDQLEENPSITIRERVAALTVIGRMQLVFASLRKQRDEPEAGSAARDYAAAFDAARRRQADSRNGTPATRNTTTSWDFPDSPDDDLDPGSDLE